MNLSVPFRRRRRGSRLTRGALVAVLCFAGCAGLSSRPSIEAPQVSLANVQPIGTQGLEARVRIDLRLANSNDFELVFEGMRFDFDVNGRRFARGQTNERLVLPRLGDTLVSVDVTTNLMSVLQQLMQSDFEGLGYRMAGDLFLAEPTTQVLDFEVASDP